MLTIEKSATNLKLGASTAYEKANTVGTDENLFRLVSVPGHGARVLPLELVSVPGPGAQISARATTKGYVQTGACARAPGTGTKSEQGFSLRQKRFSFVLLKYEISARFVFAFR